MKKKKKKKKHFCMAFKGCDFCLLTLSRFSFIPSIDLKDGYCNFMVSYV